MGKKKIMWLQTEEALLARQFVSCPKLWLYKSSEAITVVHDPNQFEQRSTQSSLWALHMMIAAILLIYIIQILSLTYRRKSVVCRMMLCLAESGEVGIVVHTQKVTKVKWKGHV